LFAEGFKAHQERRLAAAMERYREALRLDPAFYEASFNLGLAAFELKDSPTSLAAYETALAIDPRSVDARYNFALALQRGNYLIDAADELEKILARHPDESRAHFSLGKLYAERLSRFDLARLHYRRLLELQPHHPQATAIRYWLAAHP
jgi:tetratricopeptide (TPR) repeat protein